METVHPGDSILFTRNFFDEFGDPYDPSEVTFRIAKNATTFLTQPVVYDGGAGDISKTTIGNFAYSYQTTGFITPGLYNARWEANINGIDSVFLETFQVLERRPEPNSILDAPRTYGIQIESSSYRTIGMGETDRIFLVGHADGIGINNPYQVFNMQEAVNALGAHSDSPMIRALLECYNMGARDIWIVAAAPEGEYVPFDYNNPDERLVPRADWGGKNFYERYYERLEHTYRLLEEYDYPEIIVPVEASAHNTGNVDFVRQLVDHCEKSFEAQWTPRIGIIGVRMGNFSTENVQSLIDDPKFEADYGVGGKFVMVVQGEASFSLSQLGISHIAPVAATVAALLSNSSLSSGATYKLLGTIIAPYGRELTKQEYRALAEKRINPLIRTARGRRGAFGQSVIATDNTLASDGSDYWSIVQVRMISKVIQNLRALGNRYLGTVGFLQFQGEAEDYMESLVLLDHIRGYDLDIFQDTAEVNKVIVDVSITPYFGVREIGFQVKVGPGV